MANVGEAISALCPGAQFTLVGDNYADVVWLVTPTTIPTQAQIDAWVPIDPDAAIKASGIAHALSLNFTQAQAEVMFP